MRRREVGRQCILRGRRRWVDSAGVAVSESEGVYDRGTTVKPESGGPTEQRFMHSEDEGGNRMTIETRLTADGKWALDTFLLSGDRSGQRALLDQTKLHPADQWYWVALRYDGTTETSYINGVKELEGPVHFAGMGEKGRISLGVRLNMVNWFKGEIKEVRIVPRVVAEGELQRVK